MRVFVCVCLHYHQLVVTDVSRCPSLETRFVSQIPFYSNTTSLSLSLLFLPFLFSMHLKGWPLSSVGLIIDIFSASEFVSKLKRYMSCLQLLLSIFAKLHFLSLSRSEPILAFNGCVSDFAIENLCFFALNRK